MALCLSFAAATVSADVVWSSAFDFDGSEITEPVLLKPTDSIGYTTTVAGGSEKELSIRAINDKNPSINKLVHYEYVGDSDAEGTVVWNYTSLDIPKNETYTLKEMIDTTSTGIELSRRIMIIPEPAALLILGLVGAMFLRRRAKSLLVVLAFLSLGAIGAKATTISVGKCFQMWPFDRKVIINYTVSNLTEPEYINFYFTTDNGESSYDLREYGTLTGDVGPISGNGSYRVSWVPTDETLYSVKGKMKIGVDVYTPPAPPTPSTYMVVDLSNNEISYLDDVPSGGWTSTYKTTKMVFRYIPAGSFTMGSPVGEFGRVNSQEKQHTVTLTKGFYIGVFEVTQKQYELVTGSNPTDYAQRGDDRPVAKVSYDMARGSSAGAGWPSSSAVDSTSYIGQLRTATGCNFDLPTEAQWEYACRATTTTSLNSGKNSSDYEDDNTAEVARYWYNTSDGKGSSPYYRQHTTVGCYLQNNWGLYDMHGNIAELCLDWFQNDLGTEAVTDPVGPSSSQYGRSLRGGDYSQEADIIRSAFRNSAYSSSAPASNGLRLVLVVD